MTALRRLSVVAAALLAAGVVACGGGRDAEGVRAPKVSPPPGAEPLAALGDPEGRLDLVVRSGYAEDGSSTPAVDWVTGFERRTGCRVHVEEAGTSEEMVRLVRTGRYDGVSAPGDAALRLIAGGDVAPINTALIPSYADVFEALKRRHATTVDGRVYGVPVGRAATLLMWRKDRIPGSLNSWAAIFDPVQMQPYKGRVTVYDGPMTIAVAALFLKARRPELGIRDPYALDDRQFRAAVELLEIQREFVGDFWSTASEEIAVFARGDAVVGTSRQAAAQRLRTRAVPVPVETTLPKEGSTGWSDAWMVHAEAERPTCMYLWMDHVTSPAVNAELAEWSGQAPANRRSCELTDDEDHCERFHAEDETYFDEVAFWITPTEDCGDERGDVCKDHVAWASAWRRLTR